MEKAEIERIKDIIHIWAAEHEDIHKIHLYGSLIKGGSNNSSDIDIAIDCAPTNSNISGYAFWITHGIELEQDLQLKLPERKVHMEYYNEEDNKFVKDIVKMGIEDSSLLVYSRN